MKQLIAITNIAIAMLPNNARDRVRSIILVTFLIDNSPAVFIAMSDVMVVKHLITILNRLRQDANIGTIHIFNKGYGCSAHFTFGDIHFQKVSCLVLPLPICLGAMLLYRVL